MQISIMTTVVSATQVVVTMVVPALLHDKLFTISLLRAWERG